MYSEEKKMQRLEGVTRCDNKSELSEDNGYVETSHLNHDKRDQEIYLSPDVVVMCSPVEHYAYHLMFKGQAELIGLKENENEFAIRETFKRAVFYLKKHHDMDFENLPRERKKQIIARAWNYWSYYLDLPFFEG